VQDLKDTFYATLRNRIANLNPGRTAAIRGTIRPGLLVTENELPTAAQPAEVFALTWSSLAVDPLGMAKLTAVISYSTAGSTGAAGMDRGRALAAMDAELQSALATAPQSAPLTTTAEIPGGGATTQVTTGTNLFWTSPAFAAAEAKNERLERTATVEVFGYE
jgi:hypothetical protein